MRLMRGIGEILSGPLALPALQGVLVNPGVALSTKAVFGGWRPTALPPMPADLTVLAAMKSRDQLLRFLKNQSNDLEPAAIALAPAIADVLAALRSRPGCELARMSGSGATCFGLYLSEAAAAMAAQAIGGSHPDWWMRATSLG
jgi:4-diphosphocytidyl-2-C-methyl-D-erythritol kinase